MKKSKFRNNNYNNQGYSLNFKFDSVSPAGKCSGTALDLIKRYNDLAKEAHGNGDYVEAEVFRQFAEHYRKIVTEINERKQRFEQKENTSVATEAASEKVENETPVEQSAATVVTEENSLVETKPKKAFKVIEITETSDDAAAKPSRAYKPRPKKTENSDAANA